MWRPFFFGVIPTYGVLPYAMIWKVEDVKHFVLECEEFDQDRCRLLERIKGIVGAEEWVKGYEEGGDDSRVSLLLGRRVDVNREVMDDIDRCIMKEMVTWWQRCKVLLGWVN